MRLKLALLGVFAMFAAPAQAAPPSMPGDPGCTWQQVDVCFYIATHCGQGVYVWICR